MSFFELNWLNAPARTEGSWPRMSTSTPAITPMPTTKPEPTLAMRSRIGILPREASRVIASSPPPCAASSCSSDRVSSMRSIAVLFSLKLSARVSSAVSSSAMDASLPR